jgi:2-polyprenyl-3-methyl-5-hydroxy-6-metoxy-1,4-benzoquinol methylase
MIRTAYDESRVVRCRGCGLDYMWPLPDRIDGIYEEDYFRAYQDAGMVFPTESALHPRFAARLRAVEQRRGRGRLLEIGVGHGAFLQYAAMAGWEVVGVELSRYAAAHVRSQYGLTVIDGSIESAELPTAAFDMVHLSHVLEHLLDPLNALRKIRTLLSPGGMVAIEVPNELDNLHVRLKRLLGSDAAYPVRCTHITFFTPATLRQMLQRAGYHVTQITTMRDATDRQLWRALVKRAGGAIEAPLHVGPLIEALATSKD